MELDYFGDFLVERLQSSFIMEHNMSNSNTKKYLTIKAKDENKILRNYDLFTITKLIHEINYQCKLIFNRKGNLILQVPNKIIAEKFLKLEMLGNIEVEVSYNDNLNRSKGTFYSKDLINLSDEEVFEGLVEKNPDIVSIWRYKRKVVCENKTKEVYTGLIQVTFDSCEPPAQIKVGFLILSVRKFFPTPMRCIKCQKIGHRFKYCKAKIRRCVTCAKEIASDGIKHKCKPMKCINCAEAKVCDKHPANDTNCTTYMKEKEISKISTEKKISRKEAMEKYIQMTGNSFNLQSISEIINYFTETTQAINTSLKKTVSKSNKKDKISEANKHECKPLRCIKSAKANIDPVYSATDKNCPTFSKEKQILKIMADEKVTRKDALKKYANSINLQSVNQKKPKGATSLPEKKEVVSISGKKEASSVSEKKEASSLSAKKDANPATTNQKKKNQKKGKKGKKRR